MYSYYIKIWIDKNYCVLLSFDYNLIVLLFIATVLLFAIITITIIITKTDIGTISLNFPSIKSTAQHNTLIAITIGYLNNDNQTLPMISMLIYINHILSITNPIRNNRINTRVTNKIQLSKHHIHGINYNNGLCFVASWIILQHSNLWNHYWWNI